LYYESEELGKLDWLYKSPIIVANNFFQRIFLRQ
jgi:hypothetical protein